MQRNWNKMLVNCPEVLTFSFSMCGEYFFLSIRLFRFAFEFGILLGISIKGIKKYCRENANLKITCVWRTNVNGDSLVVQGVPHVDLETQMFKMKYQDFFYVTNLDETQEYGEKNINHSTGLILWISMWDTLYLHTYLHPCLFHQQDSRYILMKKMGVGLPCWISRIPSELSEYRRDNEIGAISW